MRKKRTSLGTSKQQVYREDRLSAKSKHKQRVCGSFIFGVTVHTGNADGGHYFSFIKERNEDSNPNHQERWFLFNDAEVKLFDPSQIAADCFGGEMTSKTYDSVTEKYLDFSFEKTNSAYMLFYEWRSNMGSNIQRDQASKPSTCTSVSSSSSSISMVSIPLTATTTSSGPPVTSSTFASSGTCTSISIRIRFGGPERTVRANRR